MPRRLCRTALLAPLLAALTLSAAPAGPDHRLDVLLVGNSMLGGQAQLLVEMARAAEPGVAVRVDEALLAGGALVEHASGVGPALSMIRSGDYDVVALVESPFALLADPERSFAAAALLVAAVEQQGAQAVLLMPYHKDTAHAHLVGELRALTEAMADALGVKIVPLGLSWSEALAALGPGALYSDPLHPSATGRYLIGASLFSFLTGRVAPAWGQSGPWGLHAQDAALLREIAWTHVRTYGWSEPGFDLDQSGAVGASDVRALLAGWGDCGPGRLCPGDVDLSGQVDEQDALAVLAHWGRD